MVIIALAVILSNGSANYSTCDGLQVELGQAGC
jgi:hypothetical protein